MSRSIHQEVVFETTPARVYELLTDAEKFSKMSAGAPAEIDPKAGGAFSCFGGMILGRNVECVPGERVVQAWRVKLWEPGVYSMVRFELRPERADAVIDQIGLHEQRRTSEEIDVAISKTREDLVLRHASIGDGQRQDRAGHGRARSSWIISNSAAPEVPAVAGQCCCR